MIFTLLSFAFIAIPQFLHGSSVPQGFPARWDGDHFDHAPCEVIQTPPSWLDGYFFCQLCASYGDQSSPDGQHVEHMFDAIGGLAVFDVSPNKTTFTGAYYPTKSYKVWNYYDRDFSQSSVAWKPTFAKLNTSAYKLWEKITPEWDIPSPNVDFWKINNDIVAGTETYAVGYTFDHETVDNFKLFPFKEASPTLLGQPMIPIHMPIHERVDPETGLLWASVIALDVSKKLPSMHQVVFSVDKDGVRKVEGKYDFAQWDPSKCQTGVYPSDPKNGILPRYMHSITSTKNYIILPLTSVAFNPCLLLKGPKLAPEVSFGQFFNFDKNSPLTFLVFDKRSKKFVDTVLTFDPKTPLFISHQINAYEVSDRVLVADMIGYSDYAYDALNVKRMLRSSDNGLHSHAYRYTLDLDKASVTAQSILPDDPTNIEFPQFNHNFEGLPYKFGYAITNAYNAGNSILKIDLSDFSGKKNKIFKKAPENSVSLLEPYFVQRPGGKDEDDGVLVTRGYDTTVNKTRVYVLDAKTMEQVGEILAPTDTPFGFHERFYLKDSFKGKKSD